jgi:Polysaccharide pyruvyl transferase.
MKIGIITYPPRFNYGAILQSYALEKVLARLGHDAWIVQSKPQSKLLTFNLLIKYFGRIIKRYILKKGNTVLKESENNEDFKVITQRTWKFVETHTKQYYTTKDFIIKRGDFDCLVVGSDQIWRAKYFPNIERNYLDYASGWKIKKIAYAPSFGVDNWEYSDKQTAHCKKLIKNFLAVSVREESGILLAKEHFGIDAEFVLDPTMLLSKEDYIKIIKEEHDYDINLALSSYVLDEDENNHNLLSYIAKDKNMDIFKMIGDPTRIHVPAEHKILPSFGTWLNMFNRSKFLFTDSFHGTVFAIIFNLPFVVYGNTERGLSRINSLLHLFNLENRLINTIEDYDKIKNTIIDWHNVNIIKEGMVKQSISFLTKALND